MLHYPTSAPCVKLQSLLEIDALETGVINGFYGNSRPGDGSASSISRKLSGSPRTGSFGSCPAVDLGSMNIVGGDPRTDTVEYGAIIHVGGMLR